MNHYTEIAITAIGELIGHVDTVVFDPTKSQRRDFVRVKIIINVSKPLSKFHTLRGGYQHTVYFHYEKVQKICFLCQRLTHASDRCPFRVRNHMNVDPQSTSSSTSARPRGQGALSETYPLFGVLNDD